MPGGIRAVVVDIEGTTTPVRFVYQVLFPYARSRVESFLRSEGRTAHVNADVEELWREHAEDVRRGAEPPAWMRGQPDLDLDGALGYVGWLMDRDRKSTALKALQGKIWQSGYARGDLRGIVYPDVGTAFKRWTTHGRVVAVFSSGSVLAQRLLFSSCLEGDLTRYISHHFDTTTGAKLEPESYLRIAAALGAPTASAIFVSDAVGECDAARAAGMTTLLCVREQAPADTAGHAIVRTFDSILPGG